MLLIDKLDADAMHQMPMMESSIVTAKIPLSYELTLMWHLAIKLTTPGVESPMILALIWENPFVPCPAERKPKPMWWCSRSWPSYIRMFIL